MTTLEFDTEGITDCPMSETATREECEKCNYYVGIDWRRGIFREVCCYEDIFPEEEE